LKEELATLKDKNERDQEEINKLQISNNLSQNSVDLFKNKYEELESSYHSKLEYWTQLRNDYDSKLTSITEEKNKLKEYKHKYKELSNEIEENKEAYLVLENKLKEIKKKKAAQISELQKRLKESEEKVGELEREVLLENYKNAELNNLKHANLSLLAQLSISSKENESKLSENINLVEKYNHVVESYETLRKSYSEAEQIIDTLRSQPIFQPQHIPIELYEIVTDYIEDFSRNPDLEEFKLQQIESTNFPTKERREEETVPSLNAKENKHMQNDNPPQPKSAQQKENKITNDIHNENNQIEQDLKETQENVKQIANNTQAGTQQIQSRTVEFSKHEQTLAKMPTNQKENGMEITTKDNKEHTHKSNSESSAPSTVLKPHMRARVQRQQKKISEVAVTKDSKIAEVFQEGKGSQRDKENQNATQKTKPQNQERNNNSVKTQKEQDKRKKTGKERKGKTGREEKKESGHVGKTYLHALLSPSLPPPSLLPPLHPQHKDNKRRISGTSRKERKEEVKEEGKRERRMSKNARKKLMLKYPLHSLIPSSSLPLPPLHSIPPSSLQHPFPINNPPKSPPLPKKPSTVIAPNFFSLLEIDQTESTNVAVNESKDNSTLFIQSQKTTKTKHSKNAHKRQKRRAKIARSKKDKKGEESKGEVSTLPLSFLSSQTPLLSNLFPLFVAFASLVLIFMGVTLYFLLVGLNLESNKTVFIDDTQGLQKIERRGEGKSKSIETDITQINSDYLSFLVSPSSLPSLPPLLLLPQYPFPLHTPILSTQLQVKQESQQSLDELHTMVPHSQQIKQELQPQPTQSIHKLLQIQDPPKQKALLLPYKLPQEKQDTNQLNLQQEQTVTKLSNNMHEIHHTSHLMLPNQQHLLQPHESQQPHLEPTKLKASTQPPQKYKQQQYNNQNHQYNELNVNQPQLNNQHKQHPQQPKQLKQQEKQEEKEGETTLTLSSSSFSLPHDDHHHVSLFHSLPHDDDDDDDDDDASLFHSHDDDD